MFPSSRAKKIRDALQKQATSQRDASSSVLRFDEVFQRSGPHPKKNWSAETVEAGASPMKLKFRLIDKKASHETGEESATDVDDTDEDPDFNASSSSSSDCSESESHEDHSKYLKKKKGIQGQRGQKQENGNNNLRNQEDV
ncbi:hypothetical protein WDU94_013955, partial [Cyamophila willieti]